MIERIARLPEAALLEIIRFYEKAVSPYLPALLGPGCGCRFAPTCSHYAADSIRIHGVLAGTWLALRRIAKCTPLHPGGLDPVPPAARPRGAGLTGKPSCVRITGRISALARTHS